MEKKNLVWSLQNVCKGTISYHVSSQERKNVCRFAYDPSTFSLTAFWVSADLKFSPKYPQIMTTCPVLPQQLQIADPIHITFKT